MNIEDLKTKEDIDSFLVGLIDRYDLNFPKNVDLTITIPPADYNEFVKQTVTTKEFQETFLNEDWLRYTHPIGLQAIIRKGL